MGFLTTPGHNPRINGGCGAKPNSAWYGPGQVGTTESNQIGVFRLAVPTRIIWHGHLPENEAVQPLKEAKAPQRSEEKRLPASCSGTAISRKLSGKEAYCRMPVADNMKPPREQQYPGPLVKSWAFIKTVSSTGICRPLNADINSMFAIICCGPVAIGSQLITSGRLEHIKPHELPCSLCALDASKRSD